MEFKFQRIQKRVYNIEGNEDYVLEVIVKLEQSFEEGFRKEIKEVAENNEKFEDVRNQTVICKIDKK